MTSESPPPPRQRLPRTGFSRRIDGALAWLGDQLGWVWLALTAIVVLNVTLRYLFNEGRIELEELQWHLYSAGFLLGMAVCFASDQHVRVDVIHERLSLRMRAWIELYGLLLLFFPFVFLVGWHALPFVEFAWRTAEVSPAPGGLPFRWLIKAALPLAMLLLGLAGLARLTRVTALLFGTPEPLAEPVENRPNNRGQVLRDA